MTGSRAGATEDPGAMRAVLEALMAATTGSPGTGNQAAAQPRIQPGANKAMVQRLRSKARAKLSERAKFSKPEDQLA
eukprot:CAMPEP_0179150980 /NCGR_PEP_ID=MMETSP0796-20121207/73263_1 /TAXON_ID=73915 /ORGANISM="Pyrodinium bahamense, Strain pbaha01" /LENGTH=76 /DNA_ID=CAMNT_0020852015 /DNA_START=24 /DNA_END=251 /DNA_ORIENTATION=-